MKSGRTIVITGAAAREFGSEGITVNVVAPGVTITPSAKKTLMAHRHLSENASLHANRTTLPPSDKANRNSRLGNPIRPSIRRR
jgi:NAD(P)-dependent dehydrogenase (short-subunit alcohol dehydrogenase family)